MRLGYIANTPSVAAAVAAGSAPGGAAWTPVTSVPTPPPPAVDAGASASTPPIALQACALGHTTASSARSYAAVAAAMPTATPPPRSQVPAVPAAAPSQRPHQAQAATGGLYAFCNNPACRNNNILCGWPVPRDLVCEATSSWLQVSDSTGVICSALRCAQCGETRWYHTNCVGGENWWNRSVMDKAPRRKYSYCRACMDSWV